MPALLVTLAAFALILLLVRLRAPLALAIVAGAVTLGLAFGMSPAAVARACLAGVVRPLSLGVVVTVLLLLAISEIMQASGQTRAIVELAGAFFRRPAVTMAALPALIGLLPMPGGALFSAPMVASAAAGAGERPALLSAINYWYRHPWEYFWPLYPGVILAMTLTHMSLARFSLLQAPLALLMGGAGLLLLRRAHPTLRATGPAPAPGTKRRLVAATAPIWLILVLWAAGSLTVRLLAPAATTELGRSLARFLPIAAALLASLAWTVSRADRPGRLLANVLRRRSLWVQAGLIAAVMVYQNVLTESQAAPAIAAEMAAHGLPLLLVVVGLPAIAGLTTGVAFGFVGSSFPIVLGLVAAAPGAALAPYAVLAYAAGHVGMMSSPIHLCYVVSNRFFETPFGPVYRHLALPLAVTATGAVAYFVLLRALFP